MLVVVVLLATVLLRVAIVTAVVYLLLPQGSLCPHCNLAMVAVRNRVLDQLVPVLQRRWCLECGWNGVVRRGGGARGRGAGGGGGGPPPAPRPPSPIPHPLFSRGARPPQKKIPPPFSRHHTALLHTP